ncbi:hypothetical protein [Flammeovirga sp. OC4]|uniref:hypothetical protein n=1 Tax=Flammeovirga sp. OC4 TaxID=1382345 RepID=UPI0005C74478|nr:hypothetical protein [Flammeovirga sp. OC4]
MTIEREVLIAYNKYNREQGHIKANKVFRKVQESNTIQRYLNECVANNTLPKTYSIMTMLNEIFFFMRGSNLRQFMGTTVALLQYTQMLNRSITDSENQSMLLDYDKCKKHNRVYNDY